MNDKYKNNINLLCNIYAISNFIWIISSTVVLPFMLSYSLMNNISWIYFFVILCLSLMVFIISSQSFRAHSLLVRKSISEPLFEEWKSLSEEEKIDAIIESLGNSYLKNIPFTTLNDSQVIERKNSFIKKAKEIISFNRYIEFVDIKYRSDLSIKQYKDLLIEVFDEITGPAHNRVELSLVNDMNPPVQTPQ